MGENVTIDDSRDVSDTDSDDIPTIPTDNDPIAPSRKSRQSKNSSNLTKSPVPLIHQDDVDSESLPMPVAPSGGSGRGSRSPSDEPTSNVPVSTFQTQNSENRSDSPNPEEI